MKKKTIMPKTIYDKYMKDVKNGFAPNLLNISQITDPYNGQLGVNDENILYMYQNNEWQYVEMPKCINLMGKCIFGEFQTYYIYWVNYCGLKNYFKPYLLTSIPIEESDYESIDISDDVKLHNAILEFANEVVRFNGTAVFTDTEDEAIMQACIKAEQYKYEMISAVIKQFENVSCEFIPEEEVIKDEN